jgi:O-antigen ligase
MTPHRAHALTRPTVDRRELLWIGATALFAVALGWGISARPAAAVALVGGGALLALALVRPLAVLGLMLLLGPLDLALVTGGYKSMLAGMGGLDMNGVRLIGLVASLTAVALVDREVVRHAFERYGRWYALFLLWAAATLVLSPDRVDGLRLLLKLAYPFLLFIAVMGLVRTRAELDALAGWALAGAAAVALLYPLFIIGTGRTVHETFLHRNPLSFYLLVLLLFSFARFLVRGQARYLALAAVLGVWMSFTLTRITFGAALVALLAMALYDAVVARRARTLVLAVAAMAVIAVSMTPVLLERTFGFVPSAGELLALASSPGELYRAMNWQGRQTAWPVVLGAFLTNPITGLGLGASTSVMYAAFAGTMGGVIHNEYLRLATDTGLIGVALFAAALLAWLRGVVHAGRSGGAGVREYALPAFAALLAWSVISLTDNAFDYYAPFTQFVAFLCAGALVGLQLEAPDQAADAGTMKEHA